MQHTLQRRLTRTLSIVAALAIIFLSSAETVQAVSSWSPTLLVNTEAFQTIDAGDASTNIELRFGATGDQKLFWDVGTSTFKFTKAVVVQGNLTVTGALLSAKGSMSGARLRVDGNSDLWGTLGVSGATVLKSTLTVNGNTKVRGGLSGATLRVDGNADVWGALSATGAIKTRSDLTINSDNDSNNATITFGNTVAQTLQLNNTTQRFEFSAGLKVRGTMSGSHLRVDKNADIWGNLGVSGSTMLNRVTYTWPGSQGAANTFLKNDGAGALSWGAAGGSSVSSGQVLSLHPEYPGAVYFQSGSTAVGTLTYASSGALDNYYRWSTTRATLQDYWMSVRVQVPKTFTHFETASGIQLRLRTSTTSAADNYVSFRVLGTSGALVNTGTSGVSKVSNTVNTWRTHTITGLNNGVFTGGAYLTLLIKLAATSTGFTDIGFVNLNWSAAP